MLSSAQTSAKAHEAKGATEAKTHSTTERVKEARRARPRCVAACVGRSKGRQAAFLAGPLRAAHPSFAPPARCRHSADAPRGAARPQMAHDAKESIASGLHKVGEKLHIVDPEKKI